MRQRINSEQLQELTPAQQERLREWWRPQEHDVFVFNRCCTSCVTAGLDGDGVLWSTGGGFYFNKVIPLLSIGQCIELLMDKKQYDLLPTYTPEPFMGKWNYCKDGMMVARIELIDTLWQAVKSIL